MRFPSLISAILSLSAVTLVVGQDLTMTDELGNIILATIATDVDGDPTATLLVETLTPAEDLTTSSTSTSTTTTLPAATTTDPVQGVGQPAVVGQPASRCTTAGCPVLPTTYTQNGAIVTWFATTPTTPIPTWTSSGQVEAAASYITTISTAKGLAGGAAGSMARNPFGFAMGGGDYMVMAAVAVVGGLVGAVAVL